MKRLKLLSIVFAISMSIAMYARPIEKFEDMNSISSEIEKLLETGDYDLKEGATITIFFSISEEDTIQCLSVASSCEEVNSLLKEKLENQLLMGDDWRKGKIYELSVETPVKSGLCAHS
ncbi:hypothetical protein [Salinimicrobium soli]|uniref:hypothetical protein n=1 Tax=Salinimicrobium soli TaxID=1254399 RepID=UPI003AAEE0AF